MIAILMPTYNHGNFITQSIEGVVSQLTDFTFKLFIVDDYSTDNNSQICQQFADAYPDKIVFSRNERNLGANKTGEILREKGFSSNAKYVAICEGDDYWTDPYKLQKQVDFLEANKGYSICFHPAYEMIEGTTITISNSNLKKSSLTLTIEDLALGNFIHTPTVVFRNIFSEELPQWILQCPVGDYPLYLLVATYGKIKFLNEPMAVYRIHNESSWSSLRERDKWQKWINVLEVLIPHFKGTVREILEMQAFANSVRVAELYNSEGDTEKYLTFLSSALLMDTEKTHGWLRNNYIPLLKKENIIMPDGVGVSFKHFSKQLLYRIKMSLRK